MVFFTTAIVYLIYKSLLNQNKLNGNLIKFSDLFRGYSHSFFGGGLFALLTELWITTVVVLTILLLFHNSRALQAIMNDDFETAHDYTCNNFAIHLYLFFTSFFVAGLIEEISKGYLLQYIVKLYLPHFNYIKSINMNQFIWFGIVIGLGFGTIEGIIYVCIYGGSQGFLSQIILWLIRAFIAIPFHTITGCLWGIKYFDSIRSSSSSSWTKKIGRAHV